METKQKFWEGVKQKYEDKNKTLQKRQQELRCKLEAMNTIVGKSATFPDKVSAVKSSQTSTAAKPLPEAESEKVIKSQQMSATAPEHADQSGGFFKSLFCAFGSSKPKTAPAAASQVVPTKLEDRPIVGYRFVQNENCECEPCAYDESQTRPESKIDNEEQCTCSVCSRSCACDEILQKQTDLTDEPCNCALPQSEVTSRPSPKVIAPDMESNKSCICSGTSSINNNKQAAKSIFSSPSKLSLKSIDLFYMKNIQELATEQKNLLKEITDLEQKTQIYDNVFNEYKNIDFSAKNQEALCPCIRTAPPDPNEKSVAELKLENFLLKSELKDMRLEVRQYLERMEGPMQFKIESERFKCCQLEQKLEEAARELANVQDLYQKELNAMKLQLCSANASVYNLTATNEQLTEDTQNCQKKCAKLEDDLIRQKISEADTIKRLQAALDAQNNEMAAKDECNLHQIARELSKVLKDCEPCGECMTLPEDLLTAANLLKSLTDMIENKLPKDEDDIDATKGAVEKMSGIKQDAPLEIVITQQLGPATELQEQELAEEILPVEDQVSTHKEAASISSSKMASKVDDEPDNGQQSRSSVKPAEDTPVRKSVKTDPESTIMTTSSSCKVTEPKSKTLCQCVKSKKSATVDQIWPRTDEPPVLKDSSLLETLATTKKKCDCKVARKLREKQEEKLKESKGSCKCTKKQETQTARTQPASDGVDRLWPATSDKFKLSHQVTASKSQDLLKSETSVKCLRLKENFPFDVDTQVDVLNRPPDGVHVTTTITNSGTLEVITEGPEGVIETTLVYTDSGNVEVLTEILEHRGKGKSCSKSNKMKTLKAADIPALKPLELKMSLSEPGKAPEAVSAADIQAPKSGPVVNPHCKCEECPVQPAGPQVKKVEPEQKVIADQEETRLGQISKANAEETTAIVQDTGVNVTEAAPEETTAIVQDTNANVIEAAAAEITTVVEDSGPVPEVTQAVNENADDPLLAKTLSLSLHVEDPDQNKENPES